MGFFSTNLLSNDSQPVLNGCISRGNASKRLFPLPSWTKRQYALFPFLTPKILFWVRRNLFSKRASHAEGGRREGKKITMLTNKPVGHQWGSDHCCFLNHSTWRQRSHCGDQLENFSLRNRQGSWVCFWTSHGTSHLPSTPTGCSFDLIWKWEYIHRQYTMLQV